MNAVLYKLATEVNNPSLPIFGRNCIEVDAISNFSMSVKQTSGSKIKIENGTGSINDAQEVTCNGSTQTINFSSGQYKVSFDENELSIIRNSEIPIDYLDFSYSSIAVFSDSVSNVNISSFQICQALKDCSITKAVGDIANLMKCNSLETIMLSSGSTINSNVFGDISNIAKASLKKIACNLCTNITGDIASLESCNNLQQIELASSKVIGDVGILKDINSLILINLQLTNTALEVLDLTKNNRTSGTLKVYKNSNYTINGNSSYNGISVNNDMYLHYLSASNYHVIINSSSSDTTNGIKVDSSGSIIE